MLASTQSDRARGAHLAKVARFVVIVWALAGAFLALEHAGSLFLQSSLYSGLLESYSTATRPFPTLHISSVVAAANRGS